VNFMVVALGGAGDRRYCACVRACVRACMESENRREKGGVLSSKDWSAVRAEHR